ncbi:oxygenase MpaB family protein [Phenylobacterium sp.]|uniref:oxygenase MpaB family protein n=1 Tax=Phenylobacterium sp. TaxID=1871053 RepID=UPI0025EC9761|nr:oxygenase MpaB family protein [Phenylobacterium sp.]
MNAFAGLLERPAAKLLGAGRTDYRSPAGDPGLFGPGSMAWRVHANPIALAVGGVAAVILELAEPRVRTGVWEHSIFRTDPLARMQRTGEATLVTTYGPTRAAEARVAMVTRMHERVSGVTPEGQAYTALDPELMTWVHVTAGWGFLNAFDRYVAPLGAAARDRYYAEGARLGRMFGAPQPPTSEADVEALFDRMRPRLVPHPIVHEFLRIVATTSPLGLVGRALQPLVVEAAIDLTPADIRAKLGLATSPTKLALARGVLGAMARAASAPSVVRDAHARVGRTL